MTKYLGLALKYSIYKKIKHSNEQKVGGKTRLKQDCQNTAHC